MKQKKLLCLVITLLLGLSQLFAQKHSPTLPIKSGDWFETGIRIRNMAHTFDYNFDVRYEVSNKMPNGSLVLKVSFERMRLKYVDAAHTWFGYDSYYPIYLENRKKNLAKQIYEITFDSHGKISKLKSLSTAQKIKFSAISVRTKYSGSRAEFSPGSFFPIAHLKKISETIITSLISDKGLPKTLHLPNTNNIANTVVKLASFKVPKNAFIKGHIINLSKADSLYEFNREIFRFNKDGSFSTNVLAGLNSRQRWVFGQFDEYKTFSVLLEPLDTLIIKADALDFDNTVSFAGNAAAKASLSKDLVPVFNKQWVNESNYRSKSLDEFLSFQKQGQNEFDGILNKYTNRVSSEILDYCRADFKYVQAGTKLQYFSHTRNQLKPNMSLDEFPRGFFLSVDTLPVLMSGLEGGLYYDYYLRWLLAYQQTRLGMVNANQYGFFANYATAMASFNGYPYIFPFMNH